MPPSDLVGTSFKAVSAGNEGGSRKLVIVAESRRRPWKGSLIFSGVVLLATISVMVFVPNEQLVLEISVLLAGLAVGTLFLRFGVPRPWMGSIVLILFVVVWFALGAAGYAWFGGFLAGTYVGVAWGRASKNRTVKPAAPWTVDEQGFGTLAEARRAAGEALHALDGKKRGRLFVAHGAARFEVAGGVGLGLVCHRSANAADEGSWAVMVRPGQVSDESVEIQMGKIKGLMPLRLVHDPAPVEAALADFFESPRSSSYGPEWMTGPEAEATRLTAS